MKTTLAIAALLFTGLRAGAHRLDEYLQATLISVEKDHVQAEIRLTPGVAVLPIVLASIDADGDGVISQSEQHAYAARVIRDLSLTVDGDRLRLQLVSMQFPKLEEMKEGLGEIQLQVRADLPRGGGNRKLVFENHHQSRIAAYLANCLVPHDPDIRIAAQNRNYEQSLYQLDYEQAGSSGIGWMGALALLLSARLAFLWRQRGGKREVAIGLR